jgi:hypothetical protein
MADVQAKFKVNFNDGRQVVSNPVYSSDPTTENYQWSKYTPSGNLTLFIDNANAVEKFVVGKEFHIDITFVNEEKPE